MHSIDEGPPDFEALSYTWGDATEKHWISCDGKAIQVTRNLLVALQHLRQSDGPRVIWIDAVCINQEDMAERGQQVQIMGSIYNKAGRVVVWLGEAHADSPKAFELIRKLCAVADATAPEDIDEMVAADEFESLGLPAVDSPDWMALDALYWRPWFMRVWVIQEIAFSKSAIVVCGQDSVTFEIFAATANLIYKRHISSATGVSCERVIPLMTARIAYQSKEKMPLLSVLNNFRTSLATHSIDKIYALLNIATDPGILPDYTLNAKDIFRSVTRTFLEQSLDVLSFNCDPSWKIEEGLVSWALDWSCVPREYSFLNTKHAKKWHAVGAGSPSIRFSGDGRVLFAHGRVLGRVKDIVEAFMIASPSRLGRSNDAWFARREETQAVLRFSRERRWRMWERLIHKLKQYPQTGEDVRTVLQRTLIAGAPVEDDIPSGPSLNTLYNAFRRIELQETGESPDGLDRPTEEAYSSRFFIRVTAASYGRKTFTTKEGYAGMGPASTMPGDHVVALHGGKTAYVLRKSKKGETFSFVGESYLHGFMHGEGLQDGNPIQEFAVV